MQSKLVGLSASQAKRIIRTESTYVLNEASISSFERANMFEEYEYNAIIDERTTAVCKGLSGQKFLIKDRKPGTNFPPMHPWCRSTYSIVIPKDWLHKVIDENNKNGYNQNRRMDLQLLSSNKDLRKQSIRSLEKGIKSYEKQIEKHRDKIANPKKYVEDWDRYDDRRKQGLIRHWEHEITTFKKNVDDNKRELNKRGEKDEKDRI